jgi:secreted trypsin-like serine protease
MNHVHYLCTGINTASSGRIVSGNEATPGQFPYQVGLILDGVGLCGASLISETVVLSAAHCLDG